MAPVYRDFDQAELDRQYNARATVDDIWPIMDQYRRFTEEARAAVPCGLGLRYGPTEPERLDVYRAKAGAEPAPVLVYIHGGYWRLLDAADSGFMAPMLSAQGAVTVAVNYTLRPGASLTEMVRQCRAAIAWIHANIARFGGDPDRIHVSGSSAGGHLGGMLAAEGWQEAFGLPPDVIKGAALLSGLYDLEPVRLSFVNDWAGLTEAEAADISPIHRLPRPGMPAVLAVAPSETDEFKRQTALYGEALAVRGNPVAHVDVPNSNHFDIVLSMMDSATPLSAAILRMMGLSA